MYTRTLGGREVIDAPPTHLQKDERTDEYPESQSFTLTRELTIMYIYKICKPGDSGPRLFGIPRPVVSPGFLGPKCAKEHADGEEGKTDINEIICDVEFFGSDTTLFDKEQIDSHYCCRTKYGIGEHIDDDMRCKPRTLQGGHQCLVVYLRLEQIHADKHQGENGRE